MWFLEMNKKYFLNIIKREFSAEESSYATYFRWKIFLYFIEYSEILKLIFFIVFHCTSIIDVWILWEIIQQIIQTNRHHEYAMPWLVIQFPVIFKLTNWKKNVILPIPYYPFLISGTNGFFRFLAMYLSSSVFSVLCFPYLEKDPLSFEKYFFFFCFFLTKEWINQVLWHIFAISHIHLPWWKDRSIFIV